MELIKLPLSETKTITGFIHLQDITKEFVLAWPEILLPCNLKRLPETYIDRLKELKLISNE